MSRIGAAHVERVVGSLRPHHSKPREELLCNVEIGRSQPSVGDIRRLDPCHVSHLAFECRSAFYFIIYGLNREAARPAKLAHNAPAKLSRHPGRAIGSGLW